MSDTLRLLVDEVRGAVPAALIYAIDGVYLNQVAAPLRIPHSYGR